MFFSEQCPYNVSVMLNREACSGKTKRGMESYVGGKSEKICGSEKRGEKICGSETRRELERYVGSEKRRTSFCQDQRDTSGNRSIPFW
jgi:hypothetical protein